MVQNPPPTSWNRETQCLLCNLGFIDLWMDIQIYDQLDQNLLNQKRIQTTNQTQVTRPSTDDVECEVMDF